MARRQVKQRKSNFAAKAVAAGFVSCVLAGTIGFGIASAGGSGVDYDLFGAVANNSGLQVESELDLGAVSDTSSSETLTENSTRDISQGIEAIEAEEEAARLAAEEAARVEEQEHIDAAESAESSWASKAARESVYSAIAGLSDVDWSVGKEAFIAEWTERIDDYLAGSELAGQGATFAAAAWEYGVDPRWSPAIANTESSKGENCFEAYNAWGWSDCSWSSWTEAIYAHVQGLSETYGYSITYAYAKKYCPPNYENWFYNTLSEMKSI